MKLSDVVSHLRTYCPSVSQRVAVAIDYAPGDGKVAFAVPALVVLPAGDDAEPSTAQNVSIQAVQDTFTVVMVLATADAKRGDVTADVLHDLRAEIWRALIGWRPGPGYEPIEYEGGELIAMNRYATYYGLNFAAEFTIGWPGGLPAGKDPETWQEYELAGLPELERVRVEVDVIDPIADPNIQKPGPDGRVEFVLDEDFTS